jgi:hypothetical protein
MDDTFRRLIDELQDLATEDEPHVDEETTLTEAISEVQPAAAPAMLLPPPAVSLPPPAMPLPRNVRGRRY